jgi:acrylyl-CoA reductase (NADPH)
VSGKESQTDWLIRQGASRVVPRSQFVDTGSRPLLAAAWAGGVDTVGGQTLATVIRSTNHRGCVAACGVVGGAELPLTVYPFILRGVRLVGIDSAWCPDEERAEIWRRLGKEWKPDDLESLATKTPLDKVHEAVQTILAGQMVGRTVVVIE